MLFHVFVRIYKGNRQTKSTQTLIHWLIFKHIKINNNLRFKVIYNSEHFLSLPGATGTQQNTHSFVQKLYLHLFTLWRQIKDYYHFNEEQSPSDVCVYIHSFQCIA